MLKAFATVSRIALRAQVAGARRALALAAIHGDAHAAITLIFQRLDFAAAAR